MLYYNLDDELYIWLILVETDLEFSLYANVRESEIVETYTKLFYK